MILLLALLQVGPYLSPEEEKKSFVVADGFEVSLVAAEPWLANPVQMVFDARGRIWVVNMQAFPQIEAGRRPSDTCVILEDTDGDGRADRHTVFADDLNVPTGIELGGGGAYVASQPDLLFLKDTDGDGKADLRRVLFSGFGTEDNHHAINSFVWGPSGHLYFHSGIFLHSQVETPRGPVRIDAVPVIFELHPRSLELRPYVRSREFVNMWGHVFDRWGQNVLSCASSGNHFVLAPAINYDTIAPAGYPRMATPRVSCGIAFVSGDHFPPEMRGHLLVNNVTKKSVTVYRVAEDGSGLAMTEVQPPILQSKEDCFRPVDMAFGPDGALYVLDFYNLIVGQMTYNFRDPRRDHTHGRLWRIAAKGRPLLKRAKVEGASVRDVLESLRSDYDPDRYQARRALAERDRREVLPALREWPRRTEHDKLEALWMFQTLDEVEPALLRELLASKEPGARAAAVRVLSYWKIDGALDLLAARAEDEHPRVRLEAVAALGRMSGVRSFELALRALDHPMDRHLEFAFKTAALARQDDWLPALESGALDVRGRERHFSLALQAIGAEAAVKPLLALLRHAASEEVLVLIATFGGPEALGEVMSHELTPSVLAALGRAARERKVRPSKGMDRLVVSSPEAVRLAGAWKREDLRPALCRLVEDPAIAAPLRRAAVDSLAELGGDSAEFFRRQVAAGNAAVVGGLAVLDLAAAAAAAAEFWRSDAARAEDLFAPFLQRKGGPEALAGALKGRAVPRDHARLGLRYLYSVGRNVPALEALFKPAAELERAPTGEEVKALVDEVRSKGDPARGEQVFRRREMSCLKCHSIGGAGGQVGPDLAGVGSSFPADYLIESILTPGKMIKEGYSALVVATKQGDVVSGVRVREDKKELVLRDPSQGDVTIPISSIEARRDAGSIMPTGLADLLTRAEFVDLVRFLSELGRPGPYSVPDVRVVRRWRVAGEPAYSEVSGELPLTASEASFEVEVTTAGRARMRVGREAREVDLAPGLRSFTLRGRPGDRLRCEFEEMPGSPARFRLVGGP
jgi:putative heme-binding domain-containing protein